MRYWRCRQPRILFTFFMISSILCLGNIFFMNTLTEKSNDDGMSLPDNTFHLVSTASAEVGAIDNQTLEENDFIGHGQADHHDKQANGNGSIFTDAVKRKEITDSNSNPPIPVTNITDNTSTSKTSIATQQSPSYTFCPRCVWMSHITCEDRMHYIMKTRDMNRSDAQNIVETEGDCKPIKNAHLEPTKKVNDAKSAHHRQHAIDSLRGQEGEWVQDWEYARRHAYIEHVQFHDWGILPNMPNYTTETALLRNSTSWKWVDANSPVTEISLDGFCKVCSHLEITRIFIIGDSLSRGFRRSLEALLGFTHTGATTHGALYGQMVNKEYEIPCEQSAYNFSGVKIALEKINRLDELKVLTASGTPRFIATNTNKTAIVFNTGDHMKFFEEYKEGFDALVSWLDSWDVDHSKLIAFFRSTVPGHPDCNPREELFEEGNGGMGTFELLKADRTKPYANYSDFLKSAEAKIQLQMKMKNATWTWYDFKHANGTVERYNSYAKEVFDERPSNKLQVHWLNVYNSTILRRDGHIGFGGKVLELFRPMLCFCFGV